MTGKKIVLLTAILVSTAGMARGQGAEIVYSLAQTDKEFTISLQEDGISKAYTKFLDRESIVFEPKATEGRSYYRKLEKDSASLVRFPAWAEVTDDALLGYTTGLFEFRDRVTDQYVARKGYYVSIWRRKSHKDDWRIILDINVEHPDAVATREIWYDQPISGKVPITPALELVKSKQILLDSDELFNISLKAGRLEFGYGEFYGDSVRVFRPNHAPAAGKAKAIEQLTQMKGKYVYQTGDGYMSHVRDIAYTFGTGYYYENIRTARFDKHFSYVRIWKKDDKGLWKIILDIEKPFEEIPTSTE